MYSLGVDGATDEDLISPAVGSAPPPIPGRLDQHDVSWRLSEQTLMHLTMLLRVGIVLGSEKLDILLDEATDFAINVDMELVVFELRTDTRELVDPSPVDGAVAFKVQTARTRDNIAHLAAAAEDQLFVITHLYGMEEHVACLRKLEVVSVAMFEVDA